LSVIDVTIECATDRTVIGSKRIRRDLRSVHDARAQVINEDCGIVPIPASDVKTGNEFRVSVERNESIGVSKLSTVCKLRCAFLFHAHERLQFIQLEPLAVEVPHFAIHQVSATISDANHEAHDRIAMDSGHPLDAAKAIALYQSRNHARLFVIA